jgi:hypothetical protein
MASVKVPPLKSLLARCESAFELEEGTTTIDYLLGANTVTVTIGGRSSVFQHEAATSDVHVVCTFFVRSRRARKRTAKKPTRKRAAKKTKKTR